MTDITGLLVSVTVLAAVAVLALGYRQSGKDGFQRQFEATAFETSAGRLRGAEATRMAFGQSDGGAA